MLFKFKRKEQKEAVQRIMSLKTQEKQRNLLAVVIAKIIEVSAAHLFLYSTCFSTLFVLGVGREPYQT